MLLPMLDHPGFLSTIVMVLMMMLMMMMMMMMVMVMVTTTCTGEDKYRAPASLSLLVEHVTVTSLLIISRKKLLLLTV